MAPGSLASLRCVLGLSAVATALVAPQAVEAVVLEDRFALAEFQRQQEQHVDICSDVGSVNALLFDLHGNEGMPRAHRHCPSVSPQLLPHM